MPQGIADDKQGRKHRSQRDAADSTGYHHIQRIACAHQIPGKAKAEDQLAQGLNDLRNRGGDHVGKALEIAPDSRNDAGEEDGGRYRQNGIAAGAADKQADLVHQQDHGQRQNRAHDQEGKEGHPGDPPDFPPSPQRLGL